MKKVNLTFIIMSLFIGYITSISCSSDNDGNGDSTSGNELNSSIIGTWKVTDDDDVYVFKEGGIGIGCEHAEDTRQDLWTFNYTYSEKSKVVTMKYGSKTDIFKNVQYYNGTVTCVDENGDEITLVKQSKPIVIISVNADGAQESYRDRRCFIYGNNGGTYDIGIKGSYLWHKDYNGNIALTATKYADNSNMLNNYSFKNNVSNGTLSLNIGKNNSSVEKKSTIKISALDGDGNGIHSMYIDIYQKASSNNGSGSSTGGSTGGNTGSSTGSIQTGKVKATAKVIGAGLSYDKEAQFIDGNTCTIEYVYNPSTGKYYIYGGPFCSNPDANGGKGVRYDANKGYNSICVYNGVYFDYSTRPVTKYNWYVYLRFTLP